MEDVSIRAENAERLKKLTSLSASDFDHVVSIVSKEDYVPDPEKLEELLAKKIKRSTAQILIGYSATFASLADERCVDVTEIVAATQKALTGLGWSDEEIASFDSISGYLSKLASSKAFILGAKAASLFRSTGLHLHTVRSVVDIRPLFNSARDEVLANVVFTNLSLRISNSDEEETTTVVMLDHQDVIRIRDECDRALQKIDIISKKMKNASDPQLVIYGEVSSIE